VEIAVTLRGSLAGRLPGGRGTVAVPPGAAVESVLTALGISGHCVHVVNGRAVLRGTALHDGDRIELFPPAAGG
jgi:molybdopterin converting factor small subunit